jgi:hypothetical protein
MLAVLFGGFLSSGDAVALHVDTATLLRAPEVDSEFASVVTGSAGRVATLSVSSEASTIRLYQWSPSGGRFATAGLR